MCIRDRDDGGHNEIEEISNAGSSEEEVESVGAEDALEELPSRAPRRQNRRQYKIQEVIKRRQILLVQVVKEERGNKGAALTTYLSLAGRYCVLMPNTMHGGGISRKISNGADRRKLKAMIDELNLPPSMGCIVRTAGMSRTKTEIKRDFDYLARLWDEIREKTLGSSAPALIHSDSDLVKRAIRDIYHRDIEEVLVEGEEGYKDVYKRQHPDVIGGDGAIFEGKGHGQTPGANPADHRVERGEARGARQFIFHFLETDRAVGRKDAVRGAATLAVEARLHHRALEQRGQKGREGGDVQRAAESAFVDIARRARRIARVARRQRLQDHMLGVRKYPEFDVAVAFGKLCLLYTSRCA